MQRELTGSFFLRILTLAFTIVAAGLLPASAQDRIARPVETGGAEAIRGNVHPLARAEFDQGEAAASMMLYRMMLTFRPDASQQADLDALLAEQQNPVSPYYHQWLTPDQYADRFGLSSNDIAKVIAWLQSEGFTVDETARSRTYVAFSGTAVQVQATFDTAVHRFTVDGEAHYANVSDPVLPSALAQVVLAFRGLNDFRPKPRGGVARTAPRPQFTSSLSGNHFLAPDDFATIYNLRPLYNAGIDGAGQKVAVMGQTDLVLSDIATFRSVSGLSVNAPTVVLVPGSADPGVVNGDIGEADLDVEWSGAVARNATIVYVNSKNGAFDSLSYAITQSLAPVISISYGDCEPNFSAGEITTLVSLGQQANAQGQTIVGPSGDSGAADCDYPINATTQLTSATHGLAVDVPAALPYATGAGGSTLTEGSGLFWTTLNTSSNASAISYIPETAWNDTAFELAHGGSIAATGGGVSTLFKKPTWQTGVGVPNDGQRDVPDISFSASIDNDGYLVCSQGSCVNGYRQANNNLFVVGGTSAGSPVFAGIVALINQQMNAAQGNVNPRLYQLAATSKDAFHDVTVGDNKVPCTAGSTGCPSGGSIGYSAGVGYDPVTGLGSVDAYNLVMEWGPSGSPPPSFTVTASPSGTANKYNVSVAPVNGFTGTVNLSVTGLPTGATATFGSNSLVISGAASQTTTVLIAAGASTPGASYVMAVTGSGGNVTQSAAVSVALTGPNFQLAVAPVSLTLTAGTTANVGTSTVTVSALNGFTGTVSLACSVSTLPGTTCGLSANSVTNSGTVTLTVTAPTTHASLRAPRSRFFPWTDGSFAVAMGLLIVGKRDCASRKKRFAQVTLQAITVLLGLLLMVGCGGGGSSSSASNSSTTTTTVQSGTVTVTAISGTITHTATLNVTVN